MTKAFGSVKRKKAMNARFTNKVTKEKLELDMSVAVKDALERPDIENALKGTIAECDVCYLSIKSMK